MTPMNEYCHLKTGLEWGRNLLRTRNRFCHVNLTPLDHYVCGVCFGFFFTGMPY